MAIKCTIYKYTQKDILVYKMFSEFKLQITTLFQLFSKPSCDKIFADTLRLWQ